MSDEHALRLVRLGNWPVACMVAVTVVSQCVLLTGVATPPS